LSLRLNKPVHCTSDMHTHAKVSSIPQLLTIQFTTDYNTDVEFL